MTVDLARDPVVGIDDGAVSGRTVVVRVPDGQPGSVPKPAAQRG